MRSRRLCRDDYTVGWVSALPAELAAAQCLLDEEHQNLDHNLNDTNIYTLGRIGDHNVVIVCLPTGQIGNNSAAAVTTQMKSAFPSVRFILMVGVGGGVPSEADIRLGDVVVSRPCNGHGGVVQFDFGKTTPNGFQQTGFLNAPPMFLLNAISKIRANEIVGRSSLSKYLSKLRNVPAFKREMTGPDILFHKSCEHAGGPTCELCNKEMIIDRQEREGQEVMVHYGTIASGNQVMKDAKTRDMISSKLGGVLCFEMEAAGLMNNFPCLVIRGICDYADSHKNKKWQLYAASTAAAYAKEVLSIIPGSDIAVTPTADERVRERVAGRGPVGYQGGTMRVTFGNNNSGIQVGVNNGPINASLGGNGL